MIARIPPEPEPGPEELAATIDWMTYSHQQLYDMVHQGVDLPHATHVAAEWAKLGDALDEIGAGLKRAVTGAADGWTGAGADKAREAVDKLVAWAADTGRRATEVSGCVSRQADLAETARRNMPEPPGVPRPHPVTGPIAMPAEGTAPMSASSGFGGAAFMVADPMVSQSHVQQLHRQAAEVLQRFQRDSSSVYDSVPAFTPPNTADDIRKKAGPPDEGTHTTSDIPAPSAEPGRPDSPASPHGSSAPGNISGSPQPGAGPGSGSGRWVPPSPQPWPEAANAVRPGQTGLGAMPHGAPGHAEDAEHRTPEYLMEDQNLFGLDDDVVIAPPVIGEERRP